VERLKEVGAWMKANGEAIYGTTATPLEHLSWGRCTKEGYGRGDDALSHLFDWPTDGKLVVPGLMQKVDFAKLLADGTKLKTDANAQGLVIQVPSAAPDKISSTIVVQMVRSVALRIASKHKGWHSEPRHGAEFPSFNLDHDCV